MQAARGDLDGAIETYEDLVLRRPAVQYVSTLIDLYAVAGMPGKAAQQRDVILGIDQLYHGAGINTDLAMARYHVVHGDADRGLELAVSAYAAAPTWDAADVLGLAYLRQGDGASAVQYATQAVQLSPRNAQSLYDLARAELAVGDRRAAGMHAAMALAIDPYFSPTEVPGAVGLAAGYFLAEVSG